MSQKRVLDGVKATGDVPAHALLGDLFHQQGLMVVVATVVSCLIIDWATFAPVLSPLGITPWNPSIGLCVAIVLRAGFGYAPLLGVAPLLTDLIVRNLPFPWHITVCEAFVTGVCYAIAVWVLMRSRWRIDTSLGSIRDLLALLIATALAAVCAATVYNLVLLASGHLAADRLLPSVSRYGIGDLIGILVMVPFVLLISKRRKVPRLTLEAVQQICAVLLAIVVTFGVAPQARLQLSYILFLPIVWIAVRGGLAGVSAGLMVTQIGMMIILHVLGDARENVTAFQALMMALAGSGLIIGVLIDERERNERHLRLQQDAIARAARIGALGEVTTALAHELNQPLTAASNYTRVAMLAINADPPDLASARATSRRAFEQIERGAKIVVRLRDFIRVGRLEIGEHDVDELVADCISLLRPDIERTGAQIETSIPRGMPPIAVDRLQIAQVVINLLRNSIEAVEAARAPQPLIRIVAAAYPGRVELTFADNGIGFPLGFALEPNRPVESTKVDGLGIGLSLCQSIVDSHGGKLRIEGRDQGASVTLELPAGSEVKHGR